MTVSVIIVTFNEAKTVGSLLNDLQNQTKLANEILVVDGGSEDTTTHVVKKYPTVQLIHSKKGVGYQRNVGGKKATGQLLVFLDADVRLPKNYIANITAIFRKQRLQAACPKYQPITNSWLVKMLFTLFNIVFAISQNHYPCGAGPCMIVTKKRFKDVRGFDHKLLVDDLDFVHRVGKRGAFAIIPLDVFVSDRRFIKYGFWPTFWQYLCISWHFMTRSSHKSNAIQYKFGEFV